MSKPLHERLYESADDICERGAPNAARLMREAAAEIEGHHEAFATIVNDKRGLTAELQRAERNHRGALDIIANWRELLVALAAEYPDDIRIRRALAGEHPMRPAPWERKP